MVVFFQTCSLLHFLLALPHMLKATRVVFFHPRPLWRWDGPSVPRKHRIILWMLRALNREAKIEQVDRQRLYELGFYRNNFECDRYVEEISQWVLKSASFKVMQTMLRDSKIALFYKMRLLDDVWEQTAFMRAIPLVLGKDLHGIAVPKYHDSYGLHRHFMESSDYARVVPWLVRTSHRMRNWLANLMRCLTLSNLLTLALLPLGYLVLLVLRRGFTVRAAPTQADVVMPLIWGFADSHGLVQGKKQLDNSCLVGDGLELERFAFYFWDWPFSEEEEAAYREFMNVNGIRYFDVREFIPSVRYLVEGLKLCARVWMGLCRDPRIVLDDPQFVKISAALLYHHFQELLFVDSVDYKVRLEFEDYLSAHVVRTIVANQRGRLTVGIHHNAPDGPYGLPVIRYAFINRYCVWGEELLRLYSPHWDRLETPFVGCLRVDYIKAAQQPDQFQRLQQFYQERYGGRRPLVLVQFPGFHSRNVRSSLMALLEGLHRLKDLPIDFQVVCRFREVPHVEAFLKLGLDEIMKEDPRIAIDMVEISTYEWVALSDVVITNGISTGMVEAAAAGKPCFSFDHQLCSEIIYGRYGTDLILKTADDFVRVFRHMGEGFRGWDCRWDQLAKDYSYFNDGKNIDRFRQVIVAAVAEVDALRQAHLSDGESFDQRDGKVRTEVQQA